MPPKSKPVTLAPEPKGLDYNTSKEEVDAAIEAEAKRLLSEENMRQTAAASAALAAGKPVKIADGPVRVQILKEAAELTTGARQEDYGPPRDNFENMANLFSAYLRHRVTPQDVAVLMVLVKASRLAYGQPKRDTFVDMACYAAIAGEMGLVGATPDVVIKDDAGA